MLLLFFINLKTNNFFFYKQLDRLLMQCLPASAPNFRQCSGELDKAAASGFGHCPHMGLKARSQH